MTRLMWSGLVGLALLGLAQPAAAQLSAGQPATGQPASGQQAGGAQPRPLCADRPGKATPPCILDVGRWQLEVGAVDATFQRGGGERDDAYAIGGFELRTGLTRRSEVEVGWTPLSIERRSDAGGKTHAAGVGDLTLGVRTALTDPDAMGLAIALEPFVSAPTATHHQGDGGWEGGLLAPMAIPVSDTVSVGFTPEVDVLRDAAGGGTHAAWAAALGASRAFGPATFGLEVWGARDDDPSGATTQASLDATAAYTPGEAPELQLDAGLNAGLNRHTPDLEAYVGVSRRF